MVEVEPVFLGTHVVFDLLLVFLLLGLSLQILLVLLLVVALVLRLEDVGNELETDVLRVGVVLLYPFSVQLLHLLAQGLSHYFLIVDFFVDFSPFPFFLGHDLSFSGLVDQLVLDFFLSESSLPLELLVVVVDAFVLAVHFPVGGLELVGLDSLVGFFYLVI